MSRFWRHFLTNGHSTYVEKRLGLEGRTAAIPSPLVRQLELTRPQGVEVRAINPASPAEEAGILEDDLLVQLADHPTTSLARLRKLLRNLPVGVPHKVILLRARHRLERWIVLNSHPDAAWQI